jgi:hypothetical protein
MTGAVKEVIMTPQIISPNMSSVIAIATALKPGRYRRVFRYHLAGAAADLCESDRWDGYCAYCGAQTGKVDSR